MGRRQRRRARGSDEAAGSGRRQTSDYTDSEGNVLTLRDSLSRGTLGELRSIATRPAASADDRWQRREELLFDVDYRHVGIQVGYAWVTFTAGFMIRLGGS